MVSQTMRFYNTSCCGWGLSMIVAEVCLGVSRAAKKGLILSQQAILGVIVKALVMVH